MQTTHILAVYWRRVEHQSKHYMKRTYRLIQREMFRIRSACWYGMEHWKDVFVLMLLLTLVCTLILNDPTSDEMVLRLFRWMGRNCSWCSVTPE